MFKTDRWTAPLYVLFFVLSGAELDLRVFGELAVVGIGIAYILSRSAGKIAGASAAAKLMKCEEKVCKYLGITLLPQAGVALGMSVTVAAQMGQEGPSFGILSFSPFSFMSWSVPSSPKLP